MKIEKNKEKPVQKYRLLVQSLFALISIWIGIEFYSFIHWLESGGMEGSFYRPPGVEGFLPISSLMSIYYFLQSGEIHDAHPAGFFIFLGIFTVSLVFGKSFCSWMCPIGFISEAIADFSEKIQKKLFKRIIQIPRFLDIPLRGLKYLLLAFFLYSIFFLMTTTALKAFLDSPYNIMADVKMWYFFANISQFALIVIGVLFFLSFLFRNFWCRYLCPYGALLGLASFVSPNKIKRDTDSCIDCGLCAKACPSRIEVDKVVTVISDECSTCMSCVDACPVANTLELKNIATKRKFDKKYLAFGIMSIYFAIIGLGVFLGYWQNHVPKTKYIKYHQILNTLGHPRSTKDIKVLNKEVENKIKTKTK